MLHNKKKYKKVNLSFVGGINILNVILVHYFENHVLYLNRNRICFKTWEDKTSSLEWTFQSALCIMWISKTSATWFKKSTSVLKNTQSNCRNLLHEMAQEYIKLQTRWFDKMYTIYHLFDILLKNMWWQQFCFIYN